MKKFNFLSKIMIVASILTLAAMFVGCASTVDNGGLKYPEFQINEDYWHQDTAPEFFPSWDVKNDAGEYVWYGYQITETPEKYTAQKGTIVFFPNRDGSFGSMWKSSKKDEILKALQTGDFVLFDHPNGDKYIITRKYLND